MMHFFSMPCGTQPRACNPVRSGEATTDADLVTCEGCLAIMADEVSQAFKLRAVLEAMEGMGTTMGEAAEKLMRAFNTHTHPTGIGPTSPPSPSP